ncbi:MAG: PatB family C-S lyase [Bacteroidales bacterium]|jgi:cystathionine beta-lyase|nr:PatB family C-S lyase [Bacteroidales bacterium]
MYNFDKIIDRAGTNAVKTDMLKANFGSDNLIPLWVADMDFETPSFIIEALRLRLEHPVLGYTVTSSTYFPTIKKWIKDRHNWDISTDWISFVPGVVHGLALVLEYFTRPGDKVIIQPPVYHPFRLVPQHTGREVVFNPLKFRQTGGRASDCYEMDFENLESVIDEHCKVLILSNPHNPAGIVWSRETLQRLATICRKHKILIISDEIHSDLTLFGSTHTPFATVSDEAIILHAPSKTFNIAGMNSSFFIIPNEKIRHDFYHWLKAEEHNSAPFLSIIAAEAALAFGNEWRLELIKYLEGNTRFVAEFIEKEIPRIKVILPEASFLIWLDCRNLGLSQPELIDLFVKKAGLALNDGSMFGIGGEGFMRLNIGCPRSVLEKALRQLSIVNC